MSFSIRRVVLFFAASYQNFSLRCCRSGVLPYMRGRNPTLFIGLGKEGKLLQRFSCSQQLYDSVLIQERDGWLHSDRCESSRTLCISSVHQSHLSRMQELSAKRCYINHKKHLIMMYITVAEGLEKSSQRDSDTSPGGAGQNLLQENQ